VLLRGVMYSSGGHFVDLVIFSCSAQASLPVKPLQATSSHFHVKPAEADVVTLSSSDTKEALELLSLSPTHGPHSPLLELRSSSGGNLFHDWPEANNMAMSVYVALSTNALSSCTSKVSAPHCT
jgi:hypothetical protein